jgi:hypothetical protein
MTIDENHYSAVCERLCRHGVKRHFCRESGFIPTAALQRCCAYGILSIPL